MASPQEVTSSKARTELLEETTDALERLITEFTACCRKASVTIDKQELRSKLSIGLINGVYCQRLTSGISN